MVTQAYHTHSYAVRSTNINHTLMEIDHPSMPEPARITSDIVDTTHNGNVYIACPAVVQIISRTAGSLPVSRISVDNVSQLLLDSLRSVTTPMPTITTFCVLQSAVNVIQWGPSVMYLSDTEITATTISGNLTIPSLIDRPLLNRASAAITPGLF